MTSPLEHSLAHQLDGADLPAPVREHQPWTDRQHRIDFAWPEFCIALEVEGATWAGGRHTRGRGFEADCEKYNRLAVEGWAGLRVTGDMVRDGRALEAVRAAFRARGWSLGRVVAA